MKHIVNSGEIEAELCLSGASLTLFYQLWVLIFCF